MVDNFDIEASTGTPVKNEVATDNRPLILMQFTGLKDKHGKEIYEGDLLRHISFPIESAKPVEFKQGMFICKDITVSTYHPNNIEIVGNIYEHPELLEAPHD